MVDHNNTLSTFNTSQKKFTRYWDTYGGIIDFIDYLKSMNWGENCYQLMNDDVSYDLDIDNSGRLHGCSLKAHAYRTKYPKAKLIGKTVQTICTTPHCVNPNHLKLVNVTKRFLTSEQKLRIKKLHFSNNLSKTELAKLFDVSVKYISTIIRET